MSGQAPKHKRPRGSPARATEPTCPYQALRALGCPLPGLGLPQLHSDVRGFQRWPQDTLRWSRDPQSPTKKAHSPPRSHPRWPRTALQGHFCTPGLLRPLPWPPFSGRRPCLLLGLAPCFSCSRECSVNTPGTAQAPLPWPGEGEARPRRGPRGCPLHLFLPPVLGPPPLPELTMTNCKAPGPPPPCAACFHTQATLRPADTPEVATAVSRRPQPWPGPPREQPVSGRTERPAGSR